MTHVLLWQLEIVTKACLLSRCAGRKVALLCFALDKRKELQTLLGQTLTGRCFVLAKSFAIPMAPVLRTVTTLLQMCLPYVSSEPLILVSQAVPGLLGDPEPPDY